MTTSSRSEPRRSDLGYPGFGAPDPAAAQEFAHLLSPLRIGSMTVRNRVASSAHGTSMAKDFLPSQRLIEYHRARAAGGIGLIIMEATSVDDAAVFPSGTSYMRNDTDAIIPWYRKLAEAVHAEGARIVTMLSHSGRNTTMTVEGVAPLAPSPIPMDRTRDIPHQLEIADIEGIVASFAAAAVRTRDGGLDGCELSFAHGNLAAQFFSPAVNRRTDAYGGTEEKRLRFAFEVLAATRAAVGPDHVLGIRLSADELTEGGFTLADALRFAPRFVEAGRLDYVNVSAGTNGEQRSRSRHYPTIYAPNMPLVRFATAIRQVVDVPVFAVGKLGDPAEAETIVAEGMADIVCMTRAQIADPELVRKVRAGRIDELRRCIYCNETCFGRSQRQIPISCVYNPRSGREALWPEQGRVAQPRHVVVVGGGPAGMEAARVAAGRGHRVDLYERSGALGGQVLTFASAPFRRPYLQIVDWMERDLARKGVAVHLRTELDADGVLALGADAVVVATGTTDTRPDIPGADLPHVATAREVLACAPGDSRWTGANVLVMDWDGRHMAPALAELLVDAGASVEIVSRNQYVGSDIELHTWHPLYERLLNKGVVMSPMQELVRVETGKAVLRSTITRHERAVAVDTVVLCHRGVADFDLARSLDATAGLEVRPVGDCWAPRQLEQAILDGHRAGREL